ncbi:MAG: hypothetical protein JW881_20510 [Spirochaetales bacterium]|nr:hypothetical protein [Spirochaetales bacterium]
MDDNPPWIDRDWNDYDFTRDVYDCGDYGVEPWLCDLRKLAGMGRLS